MGAAAAADIVLLAKLARRAERRDAAFKNIERTVDRFLERFQIGDECIGRLIALVKGCVHGLHHDFFKCFRHRRRDLPERRRDGGKMLECNRPVVVAVERQLAGEHFIHDDAERIDVAPSVHREAACLLRRDIMHRADRFIFNIRYFGLEVGNTEIRNLDYAVFDNKDILRLNVAVHDPLPVRVAERPRDLQGEVYCLWRIDRTVIQKILLERDAVDQLHNDVFHVIGAAHIVYADDVRVA